MLQIGRYNTLRVVKSVDFGVYLDGGEQGEILLPSNSVPPDCKVGDEIEAFIYFDSDDRIIATTERPYAQVDDFACLRVDSVNRVGVFLDWGLRGKQLLVPFREQRAEMRVGKYYTVYVYLDEASGRIVATAKINRYLHRTPVEYSYNQEVDILVVQRTDLGFRVIVNNAHWGMIYHSEIFTPVHCGDRLKGYVTHIRADEKVDVALRPAGYESVEALSQTILDALREAGGFLPLTDKSDADVIAERFGCSKKNFKKALGALYKKREIRILENGIESAK